MHVLVMIPGIITTKECLFLELNWNPEYFIVWNHAETGNLAVPFQSKDRGKVLGHDKAPLLPRMRKVSSLIPKFVNYNY